MNGFPQERVILELLRVNEWYLKSHINKDDVMSARAITPHLMTPDKLAIEN